MVGTKQGTEMDKAQQEEVSLQDLQAIAGGRVGDRLEGRRGCGMPNGGHTGGPGHS